MRDAVDAPRASAHVRGCCWAGAIHRADVAKLVIDALYSKKLTKKIVTAIDPSLANAPPTAYEPADV